MTPNKTIPRMERVKCYRDCSDTWDMGGWSIYGIIRVDSRHLSRILVYGVLADPLGGVNKSQTQPIQVCGNYVGAF